MAASSIEWTELTWNPVTGCTKISPGCKHCYAERMARRLQGMGLARYRNGFVPTIQPDALSLPLTWRKPRLVFVNSMSDLFHEDIPEAFLFETFEVMRQAHWHRFQVLTKRSERLVQLAPRIRWPDNVWMGVSVESLAYVPRIEHLRTVDSRIRFLSLEPLLGPLQGIDLSRIDWVIVGGESGPGCRPMKGEWVTEIRDRCRSEEIPFFFKQWGGWKKKRNGRLLEGRTWDEMPEDIQEASCREGVPKNVGTHRASPGRVPCASSPSARA